jgi:hypothetical protein
MTKERGLFMSSNKFLQRRALELMQSMRASSLDVHSITPVFSGSLTGKFRLATWAECSLELHQSNNGGLEGHLTLAEQRLEVKGSIGKTGAAFGVLLDSATALPVALSRLERNRERVRLEVDIPGPRARHGLLKIVSLSRVMQHKRRTLVA